MKKIAKKLMEKPVLVFCVIVFVQLLIIMFWGNKKSNFYWDEYYTYNNAHYISNGSMEMSYVFLSPTLKEGEWMNMSELKEYFIAPLPSESQMYNDSIPRIMKYVIYRMYYLLLALMETLLFPEMISKWSGILLNMALFIICQIFLYKLAKYVSGNTNIALLSVLFFGCCGEIISMAVFVRFYVMVFTFLLIATYLHALMWEGQKWYINIIYEVISALLVFIAFGNSELACIYGALLVGCFSLGLMIKKRWKQFCYYSLPIGGAGALYLLIKTDYIKAFFFPEKVVNSHAAAQDAEYWLVDAYASISVKEIIRRTGITTSILGNYLLGHKIIFWVVFAGLIVLIFLCIRKYIDAKKKMNVNGGSAFVSSDNENKNLEFYYIMLGTVVGYIIFSVLICLWENRYYSLMFPELVILGIGGIYLMTQYLEKEKMGRVILCVLTVMMLILTYSIPQIDNLYVEDKDITNQVKVLSKEYDAVSCEDSFVIQDCVVWSDSDSDYICTNGRPMTELELPTEFLYWSSGEVSEDTKEELYDMGYSNISFVGNTYLSHIYLVEK